MIWQPELPEHASAYEIQGYCDHYRYNQTTQWGLLVVHGHHQESDQLRNQITNDGVNPGRLDLLSLIAMIHPLVLAWDPLDGIPGTELTKFTCTTLADQRIMVIASNPVPIEILEEIFATKRPRQKSARAID
jgi:hypothetical protein